MIETQFESTGHGDTYERDMSVCKFVSDILQRHYADHPWMVGCNHEAGMVDFRLMYASAEIPTGFGYRMKLPTVLGPGGDHKIKMAGGEVLERWGLSRERATNQSALHAAEHGLDASDIATRRR